MLNYAFDWLVLVYVVELKSNKRKTAGLLTQTKNGKFTVYVCEYGQFGSLVDNVNLPVN